MRLYRLGSVSWQDSQLLYHALPRLGREGLILLSDTHDSPTFRIAKIFALAENYGAD